MVPFSLRRPITEYIDWLLPEPDSPTIPTISPCSTNRLIPRTAWTLPCSVAKLVVRFLISNKLITRYSYFFLGSKASLTPSPMKLSDSMVRQIARIGQMI